MTFVLDIFLCSRTKTLACPRDANVTWSLLAVNIKNPCLWHIWVPHLHVWLWMGQGSAENYFESPFGAVQTTFHTAHTGGQGSGNSLPQKECWEQRVVNQAQGEFRVKRDELTVTLALSFQVFPLTGGIGVKFGKFLYQHFEWLADLNNGVLKRKWMWTQQF